MKRLAQKVNELLKIIETNSGTIAPYDGQEIGHISFITVTNVLLRTAPGIRDMETGIGERIGDKTTLTEFL